MTTKDWNERVKRFYQRFWEDYIVQYMVNLIKKKLTFNLLKVKPCFQHFMFQIRTFHVSEIFSIIRLATAKTVKTKISQ